jgi:excisionase family DNA binding protein
MDNTNDNIYNVDSLSTLLGLQKDRILRLAQNGTIPSYKVGKNRFFIHSEILEYIKSHKGIETEKGENELS